MNKINITKEDIIKELKNLDIKKYINTNLLVFDNKFSYKNIESLRINSVNNNNK